MRVKPTPGAVLRVCLALLLGAAAFGLARNYPVLAGRPLLVPEFAPATGAEPPLRLVLVAPQRDHPFWLQVHAGARAAAERLGASVELHGPRRAAVEDQVQLLDMATAAQVEGIITAGIPDPRVAAAIARAVDRGIPVITVDTDLPGRRLAYVGSDNAAAGRLAAAELVRATDGRAAVGVVRGLSGPEEEDQRLAGLRAGLAAAPGIRIVAVAASALDRTRAGERALQILREHPEVTVLVGTTALDALGAAQGVAAAGAGRILILGWDPLPDAGELLARGTLHAVVEQAPAEMGARAVELLEGFLRRDVRPGPVVYTPVSLRQGGGRP